MRRRSESRRAAFTLLEVLVALAIFALAAIVLGSAYLNILTSYDAVARAAAVSEDLAFARQQVLLEPDRKKLEQGGEFDSVNGRHVRWSAEFALGVMPDVYNVTFTCEINDPGKIEATKAVEKFTLLRPTWTIEDTAADNEKLRTDVREKIQEIQQKRTP
jgi:general secretion pathway protein I